MKAIILAILFFIVLKSNGQTKTTLKDLDIPTSPGFVLLDAAPSSIEHPTSAKAFAINIFNSVAENNTLPKNIGVEFSPFWFIKTSNMTVEKYVGLGQVSGTNQFKNLPFSSLKFVSLSLATTNKTDSITKKNINNYALGAKATILKVYKKSKLTIINTKLLNIAQAQQAAQRNYLINPPFANPASPTTAELATMVQAIDNDSTVKAAGNDAKDVLGDITAKPDFSINGATSIYYFDNNMPSPKFGRFGFWLTADAKLCEFKTQENYLHFTMLSRYISDGTKKDKQDNYIIKNYWDTGGKLTLEFKKLSLAYEYIYRNEGTNNFRSAGVFKARIKDNLFISGSFGKNFNNAGGLISLLGINWGISNDNELTLPPGIH